MTYDIETQSRLAPLTHSRATFVLGLAILMTAASEIFYLIVWGTWLFPEGSWLGKLVWTLTCGIAMGAVMGAVTLLLAEPRRGQPAAFWIAAASVAVVGSYCAWLCSRIDAQFDYFGGSEHSIHFITSGVLPALAGGVLFGWLLYLRPESKLNQN